MKTDEDALGGKILPSSDGEGSAGRDALLLRRHRGGELVLQGREAQVPREAHEPGLLIRACGDAASRS